VGLTFDVLVAEQIGGGAPGTARGGCLVRSVMMSLILCLDVHQLLWCERCVLLQASVGEAASPLAVSGRPSRLKCS